MQIYSKNYKVSKYVNKCEIGASESSIFMKIFERLQLGKCE